MGLRSALALGLLLLASATLAAQESPARRTLRLAFENDLIALRGAGAPPDYDYTHGTRLAAAWPGAPSWVRRLAGGKPGCATAAARRQGCVAAALELGQEIYTPRRDAPDPVPGERPYAGWLYASGAAHLVSPRRVRSLAVAIGVTGRPSLAADVQHALHRMLGNEPQLGWAHQLAFEPGLTLRYDDRMARERALGGTRVGRAEVTWGATAGTVRTALHAGVRAVAGLRGDLPWTPTEPEVERPMRFYMLGSYRQDLVLRDLFLDGNTLGANVAGAERRSLVGQYELGIGVRRRTYTIEYRHVSRGREYVAQPGRHAYGALGVSLHRF